MSEKRKPKYATVRETADEFDVSDAVVYKAIADGKIRAIKIGGSLRIPLTEHERIRGEAA
jgi:excisionase family DNA binding protein